MPSFARDRSLWKDRLAQRLAAGERLSAICAEPGAPSFKTVCNWRRKDAGFDARLSSAQAEGAWRRDVAFDPVKAAAFLARYAEGEPIWRILRDPHMPSRRAYRYWRATDAEFAADLARIRADNRDSQSARQSQAQRGVWTAAQADRLMLVVMRGTPLRQAVAADPDFPGMPGLRAYRKAHPSYSAALRDASKACQRLRMPTRYNADLASRITARIATGASLYSLSQQPNMPSEATLYAWVRRHPAFAQAVARACEERETWYNEQLIEIAQAARPGTVMATRRLMGPITRQLVRLRNRPGRKRGE